MNNRKLMRKLNMLPTMSVAHFWSECLTSVIGCLCAVILMILILSVTIPVSEEQLTRIVEYAACGMVLLWCIPIARNTRYRLRDAGFTAKAYLWLLLPVIGWLIFIALLFVKRKPNTNM